MPLKSQDVTFYCPECGLLYAEERWAEACRDFCSEHNACSIEITSHALKPDAASRAKKLSLVQE
ncbi:MAG: hypothetical protein V3T23_05230 [Nitrososphaerales archaeon]